MAKEINPYAPYEVGKIYTIEDPTEEGLSYRGRLEMVDHEGYYIFRVTTKDCDIEEFSTRVPEEDVLVPKK